MRALTVLASAAVLLGACAPTANNGSGTTTARADRQCFFTRQVVNFRGGEDDHLYLRTFGRDVFQVSSVACPDLDYAVTLAIVPDIGSGDRLCTGDVARIYVPRETIGPNPCRVRIDRRLTEAEVDALPSRSRP